VDPQRDADGALDPWESMVVEWAEKSKGDAKDACDRISPWEMEPDVVEERRAYRERVTREEREALQHQTLRQHQAAAAHAALAEQVRAGVSERGPEGGGESDVVRTGHTG
jgi:hypothetical protein